jgi:chemotaxis protein methyltransferase CheR
MNDTHFPQLERLIAARMGLHLRPRERDTLRGTVAARMAILRLEELDQYQRLLQAGTPDAEIEWEQLTTRLTNNESYFFRDKGQMALLRERILPELIARNRGQRTLRLWSAGCAAGEEPYSLAMLVNELLPHRGAASGPPWDIFILGTDIDETALHQARQGLYSPWSFRTVEPAQQEHGFIQREGVWQVRDESRSLVSFRRINLVSDRFPDTASNLMEMDLILCRNVFIYFGQDAISIVLPKFARTLSAGGYLMTGHAEIQGQAIEPLEARMFPESVVYQRTSKAFPERLSVVDSVGKKSNASDGNSSAVDPPQTRSQRRREPAALDTAMASAVPSTPEHAPARAPEPVSSAVEARYAAGDDQGAIRVLQALPEPLGERALLLLAHAHANLGHHAEATGLCRRLRTDFPFAAEPYELLAALAQEQERYDEAKLLLKQAVYLAPESPSAYLELAGIYDREGDRIRARKMRVTALEALAQMPSDAAVGSHEGAAVQEWIQHLNRLLDEGA